MQRAQLAGGSVLDGFGKVSGLYLLGACKVGYRAGELGDAVVEALADRFS